MDITILICTWNRKEKLRSCLHSIMNLEKPRGVVWEIIVVNNQCLHETSAVIKEFREELPIKEVTEPCLGLSQARNTGIQHAKGKVLVFFDDDIVVDPFCLQEYWKAFSDFPDGALFGGLIKPQIENCSFGRNLPLSEALFEGLVLKKNLGPRARIMENNEYFFGANFAIKREVFDEIKFDLNLGKKGNQQLAGEEIRLQDEARGQCFKIVWVPEARVSHLISAERLSLSNLSHYFWGAGRTHHKLNNAILFPRLKTFTFLGAWAQVSFFCGCLVEFLTSSLVRREN